MRAAAKSDLSQVSALLSRGANPNERDASGWTALMYAAHNAGPEIIEALLQAGADVKLRSFGGQLALMDRQRSALGREDESADHGWWPNA